MKKYKNGLVLGKFYPFHLGHQHLIDTAIENSEQVHVVISHNKKQSIPGLIRYEAVKKHYEKNKSVKVYHFEDDNFPQYDYECDSLDEFYSYWVPAVYDLINELDVVFTSEDYGDEFSKYLGIEHFLVDKERVTFPISGTMARAEPFKEWDLINEHQRKFFVKRVAIMGPESVGKSTITKDLASCFNTNFVVEYGRIVYENNGNKIGLEDFIPISEGRQSLEDWVIKTSNKIVFCDTEDITTYLFMKMYNTDADYKFQEKWFLDKIENNRYDLYLLMKPDCKGVQDGTRNFLDERQEHYEEIKKCLQHYKCNFIEIEGNWADRLNKSIDILKANFNI